MIDFGALVFICQNCGSGFPAKLPENNLHDGPVWATLRGPVSKDPCWGAIEEIPRTIAIRNVRFSAMMEISDAPQES